MDDAAKMYELQKVDLTWAKVRGRLIEIQKQLGESAELKRARAKVEKSKKELTQRQTEQQDSELEARSLSERIKSTDEQLMSGAVTNPKELEALQASAESMRRHLAQVEDAAVTAMLQADELRGAVEEQEQEVSKLDAEWKGSQETLHAQEKKMKQNYIMLKRKRESMAAAMSPGLVAKYEEMRKRRGGVAVAPVKDQECGACHVSLPTGVVSALQSNRDELVICTSCGRYLVQT